MKSTLIAKRCTVVTREQLAEIATPAALGRRHKPVAHHQLLASLDGVLADAGLRVTDERIAVSREDGSRLFGVLEVAPTRADHALASAVREGQGFAIALRSSVNRSLSIRMNASTHVFVCSNLAMSGQTVVTRKSTIRLDLEGALREGVERYIGAQLQLAADIEAGRVPLEDEQAKLMIYDIFARGVVPARMFGEVVGNYFDPEPEWTDCQGRTRWALHNAMTRAVRSMPPAAKFRTTIALADLLRPGSN